MKAYDRTFYTDIQQTERPSANVPIRCYFFRPHVLYYFENN